MKYYNSCSSCQNTIVQFQKMKLEYFNLNKKTSYITVTGSYHLYILIIYLCLAQKTFLRYHIRAIGFSQKHQFDPLPLFPITPKYHQDLS
ncbi:hypothetical protein IWQ47_002199 [Aquimarina sp. EL_43]|nr:hypothetical protein [Aquimarina sp. EL_35]MBG6151118.1 hypothetical protein [Aquimarina sp. EL_32]MBG6169125.1 hypothetical protein [Aquimarina sp. EL_43]